MVFSKTAGAIIGVSAAAVAIIGTDFLPKGEIIVSCADVLITGGPGEGQIVTFDCLSEGGQPVRILVPEIPPY